MSEKQLMKKLRRITVVVIGISIFLFLVGGFLTASLGNVQDETMTTQMTTEAQEYKDGVLRKIDADMQTLQTLASFFQFSNTIREIDVDDFAKGLYESNNSNSFIRMAYFTKNGEGIRVTVRKEIERNLSIDRLDESVRAIIEKAWEGESNVSRVYDDELLGKKLIAYAIPVYEEHEVTGVLVANDEIDAFEEVLDDKAAMNGHGYIHMIGREGEFLIRSDNKAVNQNLKNIYVGDYIKAEEKEKIQEALENEESIFSEFTYRGVSYQIYLHPVGVNGWYLFCVDTMHGMNAPIYQILNVTRIVFIGVLCMSVFLLFYGYTMLRKNHKQLIRFAYYDPLTGSYNMVRFIQEIREKMKGTETYYVAVMNIRQFKFINEIFGRNQGDQLLCHVKRVLEQNLEPGEYFCRDTGDFFWVLLKGEDQSKVSRRLYDLMDKISWFSLSQHHSYQILLYCGVAAGKEESTPEEVMTHAMFALRKAKGTDRNNVWFYDTEIHRLETIQNYIESHMHQALREEEFHLFLQPKMDLSTGTIGGAEALVRWFAKDGTKIYPNQFIPLFENNGFCASLDMYMVDKVCRKLREWMDDGIEPVPISVNQTKLLFYEEDYVENLCAILQKYNVPGELVTLEILEGIAGGNIEELNNKIAQLKKIGFRISMDDFGSGYSSFHTFGRLHVDELKMDRVFLTAITGSEAERQKIIMEQIIDLAKRLQITTVAEGVETEENEQLIKDLGCNYGQGYYYSRPISADEFDKRYMKKGNDYDEIS